MARKSENVTAVEPQVGADGTPYYRVRHADTGHTYSVVVDAYDPDVHALVDEAAVDSDGLPLGPRFKGDPAPVVDAPPVESEPPVV
jgi:hypothetical protein